MRDRPLTLQQRRWMLLLLLTAPFVALKMWFDPGLGIGTADANYYVHLARNIASGDGFVTRISLYYQGLVSLPQPSTMVPMLPMLLGAFGREWADWAIINVPRILYLLDILLIYILVERIRLSSTEDDGSELTAAHLSALVLAANPVFFQHTSAPYTEGLAIAFAFSSVILLQRSFRGGGTIAAGLAGVLSSCAYLSRHQMFVLPPLVMIALTVAAIRDRRRIAGVAAAAAGIVVPVALWLARLFVAGIPFRPRLLIDFAAHREIAELGAPATRVVTDGWLATLLDRLLGVAVAFDPTSPFSYVSSFGISAFLPLVAVIVFVGQRDRWVAARRYVRSDEAIPVMVWTVWALLLLGMIHTLHYRMFVEWLFGDRYGLYLIVLIAVATVYLLSHGSRVIRLVAVAMLLLAVGGGSYSILQLTASRWPYPQPDSVRVAAAWLESRPDPPVVATTDPQSLALLTERASFHWILCEDDPKRLRALLDLLPIEYVLELPSDARCGFLTAMEGKVAPEVSTESDGKVTTIWRVRSRTPANAGQQGADR